MVKPVDSNKSYWPSKTTLLVGAGLFAITAFACTVLQAQGSLYHFKAPLCNYALSTMLPSFFSSILLGATCKVENKTTREQIDQLKANEEAFPNQGKTETSRCFSTQRKQIPSQEVQIEASTAPQPRVPLNWQPTTKPIEKTNASLLKKSAFVIQSKVAAGGYVNEDEASLVLPSLFALNKAQIDRVQASALTFKQEEVVLKRENTPSLDTSLFRETETFVLMGLFNGCGGEDVGVFASSMFAKTFEEELFACKSVYHAFERTISRINFMIEQNSNLDAYGATAVISYVDKRTNIIYTATLGNCEANIYRKINGKLVAIPLSLTCDWHDAEEIARATIRLENTSMVEEQHKITPKYPPNSKIGVAQSRGIGFKTVNSFGENHERHPGRVVICKPEITVNFLEKGDRVFLYSESVKDVLSEERIVAIATNKSAKDHMKEIADKTLENPSVNTATIVGIEC